MLQLQGKAPKFDPAQFTAGKFHTAEDKARFANQFVAFCESGFQSSKFPKTFYVQLMNTFGHIAHYDRGGFYATWFSSIDGIVAFLEHTVDSPCYGQPETSMCDVERKLQEYVRARGLLEAYRIVASNAVERAERAELARLKAKYDGPAPARGTSDLLDALVCLQREVRRSHGKMDVRKDYSLMVADAAAEKAIRAAKGETDIPPAPGTTDQGPGDAPQDQGGVLEVGQ